MRRTTQTQRLIVIPKEMPPTTTSRPKHRLLTALFLILTFLAGIHFIASMHTAYPTVVTTTCLGLIRNTDYTKFVQLQPSQEMGAVQFASQLTEGQPTALVQVINTGPQQALDVYVYGCTIQKHIPILTLLFKQQGLVQGTVNISLANTLITSEHDTTLSQTASAIMQPLQHNIYQEYIWRAGAFVQVPFPGLYPVTSRSEAEALQIQANNGQTLPWNDPLVTAQQMAKDVLHWPDSDPHDTVIDSNDKIAHVLLVQQRPSVNATVTLTRLIQYGNAGLWFVTNVQTQGITINQLSTPATSPTMIHGTTVLSDGTATVMLFDHTITPINTLNNTVLNVSANGSYTGNIFYTNNVSNQQGLLLIEDMPPDGSSEVGQLLLTNIIIG